MRIRSDNLGFLTPKFIPIAEKVANHRPKYLVD